MWHQLTRSAGSSTGPRRFNTYSTTGHIGESPVSGATVYLTIGVKHLKNKAMTSFQLINGDCLEVLKTLPDNSVDSIVTDPPYGISFMGKKWDYDVPTEEVWKECLRVLKPGGHLLSFAGTRTQHRMAVRIEDAGFEIRDMIAWIYASGFPKSLNIGKAVDKLQGNEREVVGKTQSVQFQEKGYEYKGDKKGSGFNNEKYWGFGNDVTKGTSKWEGWGTALKPALEPITVARKPLIGTVAENILTHGTGGLNIDGCRVAYEPDAKLVVRHNKGGEYVYDHGTAKKPADIEPNILGRWPANLIWSCKEDEYVIKSSISDEDILKIKAYFNVKKSQVL